MLRRIGTLTVAFAIHTGVLCQESEKPRLTDDCTGLLGAIMSDYNKLPAKLTPKQIRQLSALDSDAALMLGKDAIATPEARQVLRKTGATLCWDTGEGGDYVTRRIMSRRLGSDHVRVMTALPTNEPQLRATFTSLSKSTDQGLMQRSLKQMQRAAAKWGDSVIPSSTTKMADQVKKAAGETRPDGLLIVVAHNEQGTLRFPDGSTLLQDALGTFKSKGPLPIVLSCETAFRTSGPGLKTLKSLDFEETAAVVKNAIKSAQESSDPSIGTLLRFMEHEFQSMARLRQYKVRVVVTLTATGGISLGAIVLSKQEAEQKKKGKD